MALKEVYSPYFGYAESKYDFFEWPHRLETAPHPPKGLGGGELEGGGRNNVSCYFENYRFDHFLIRRKISGTVKFPMKTVCDIFATILVRHTKVVPKAF